MRQTVLLLMLVVSSSAAAVPATPVMTFYQFNGPSATPYYSIDAFQRSGPSTPAGTLTQGTSVIPCLVIRNGQPLTDTKGTPYVGFDVVVDSGMATPAATDVFKRTLAQRRTLSVQNHHCDGTVRYVIDVRKLYALEKAPFFDPPRLGKPAGGGPRETDGAVTVVKAFHNSAQCATVNRELMGRRGNLARAWERFIDENPGKWPRSTLEHAKHLDYTLRTAIFEGHLERGCSAYGGCERNIIALSIRNRARGQCLRGQGCSGEGDFQGVASSVSQYNIWDEYLTQISGLASCFLRDDLPSGPNGDYYRKLQTMYQQNVGDVERILFGDDQDLAAVFPGETVSELKSLRHYYHAPAMGKCFPNHDRIEYLTGATARRGSDFVLLANMRIRVDEPSDGGYLFREFRVDDEPDRDAVRMVDNYPGFAVDRRKVDLKPSSGCVPYGIPPGCPSERVGRYRRTPGWLGDGRPLGISCRIKDRGAQCQGAGTPTNVVVGGQCDKEMRPVAGVR